MSYLVPVHRYWHEGNKDHFYTTNGGEIGTITAGQTGNHGYKSEGVAFYLVQDPYPGLAPVTRYYHDGQHDHHYTANPGENVAQHGYKHEGVLGHIAVNQVPGTIPVFRYYSEQSKDHFFTTNPQEIGTTTQGQTGNHGYKSEGILGYAFQAHGSTFAPVFRYWHDGHKDHFYTTNGGEIGVTNHGQVGNHGYASEGTAFYVSQHALPGLVPINRYYHEGSHDHHYTANQNENVSQHGYKHEGVLGYIAPNQYPGTVPIFRYYSEEKKDHFFTTNPQEIGVTNHGQVGNHGYKSEGILGFAFIHQ